MYQRYQVLDTREKRIGELKYRQEKTIQNVDRE